MISNEGGSALCTRDVAFSVVWLTLLLRCGNFRVKLVLLLCSVRQEVILQLWQIGGSKFLKSLEEP